MRKNQHNREIAEILRDEMVMKDLILARLNEAPATIPELAADLKCSASEVMYWVMTMWRYGRLEETGKPDENGYYQYQSIKQG
ncbi:MAG: MarR family transcriptional regulator [Candidatus Zixiibacteriota bacterium]